MTLGDFCSDDGAHISLVHSEAKRNSLRIAWTRCVDPVRHRVLREIMAMAALGSYFERTDTITLDNLVRRFRSAEKDLFARVAPQSSPVGERVSTAERSVASEALLHPPRPHGTASGRGNGTRATNWHTRLGGGKFVTTPNVDPADRALDAALEMTFPASDPIAVQTGEAPASHLAAKSSTTAPRSPTGEGGSA